MPYLIYSYKGNNSASKIKMTLQSSPHVSISLKSQRVESHCKYSINSSPASKSTTSTVPPRRLLPVKNELELLKDRAREDTPRERSLSQLLEPSWATSAAILAVSLAWPRGERQRGQVLFEMSQVLMQSRWKAWEQSGRRRSRSSGLNGDKQMEQSPREGERATQRRRMREGSDGGRRERARRRRTRKEMETVIETAMKRMAKMMKRLIAMGSIVPDSTQSEFRALIFRFYFFWISFFGFGFGRFLAKSVGSFTLRLTFSVLIYVMGLGWSLVISYVLGRNKVTFKFNTPKRWSFKISLRGM